MNRLHYLLLAAAPLLFAACSSDDEDRLDPAGEPTAVTFDTYIGRTPTTRTASSSNISSANDLGELGFGVFAYHTGSTAYAAGQTSTTPNFMYNQKVSKSGDNWTYTPVKYWPNDIANGTAVDGQSPNPATGSESGGKVSFFAYGPWQEVTQAATNTDDATATGSPAPTTGITKMIGNGKAGDPILTYVLTSASDNVDLVWGTATETKGTADSDGNRGSSKSYNPVVGAAITGTYITTGTGQWHYVWQNCIKAKTGEAISFNFYHALAKIGDIKIAADPNNGSTAAIGGTLDDKTKITITSLTISAGDSYKTSGTFNLATGAWTATGEGTTYSFAFTTTDEDAKSKWNSAYQTPSGTSFPSVSGIPSSESSAASIYDPSGTPAINPQTIYFIPQSTDLTLTVECEYVVWTQDEQLANGCSKVSQKIKKSVTFTGGMALNSNYTLKVLIGVEDIDFTATVQGWDTETEVGPIWVPLNVKDAPAPSPARQR